MKNYLCEKINKYNSKTEQEKHILLETKERLLDSAEMKNKSIL
jgi:hypothetical protein